MTYSGLIQNKTNTSQAGGVETGDQWSDTPCRV